MATLRYKPITTRGFRCALTSDDGADLVCATEDGETVEFDGHDVALENPTLVAALQAYGESERARRRTRSAGMRKLLADTAEKCSDVATGLIDLVDDLGPGSRTASCSACLAESTHREVERRMVPAAHICGDCGSATTVCAVPGCEHMARRSLRRISLGGYCAEHRHEIPAFDRVDGTLAHLDDYAEWLDFDARNAKRITSLTVGAIGGAAVIGPMALWAAPAIGGAVGASTGLSGAAATSHGLALLGGGAVSAGGLGVAGGVAVVTAAGTGLGSAMGARVTSAYVGADDSFGIDLIEPGEGAPVIIASGFLTEDEVGWGRWERIIRTRYPERPVYRVRWGAKELKDLGSLLGGGAGSTAGLRGVIHIATTATRRAGTRLGALAGVLAFYELGKNPWTVARTRAEMTGAVLADLIARSEGQFVLVGHSLGARVMVEAARTLGTEARTARLEAVHLLGGAIDHRLDLRPLTSAVTGTVYNYWSKNDRVLRQIYRYAELGERAAGATGFERRSPVVKNRNVSRRVGGHSDYVERVELE